MGIDEVEGVVVIAVEELNSLNSRVNQFSLKPQYSSTRNTNGGSNDSLRLSNDH